MIGPGAEWRHEIDQRLRHADVVLLFISSYFIDSDYAYEIEMTEALRRHDAGEARVLPIIVSPCLWQDEPFARLQVLPTDGRPMDTWPNRNEVIARRNVYAHNDGRVDRKYLREVRSSTLKLGEIARVDGRTSAAPSICSSELPRSPFAPSPLTSMGFQKVGSRRSSGTELLRGSAPNNRKKLARRRQVARG